MVQIFTLHRHGGRTDPRLLQALRSFIMAGLDYAAEARREMRRLRMEAELRRKLEGVDDHLLRDVGLRRDGDRLERIEPRSGGDGTG